MSERLGENKGRRSCWPKRRTKAGPLASVIILNWNGISHLATCLSSLANQTYSNIEIIFVDNGSQDGSVEFVKREYGGVVSIVENIRNTGFAEGNNTGIKLARGKYILLINNDTKADPGWVEELVKAAEKDEKIGMCASKVLMFDDRTKIDTAGHLIYRDGLNRGRGRLETDRGQYNHEEEVLFPSGAAALYRKEMLDEIGGFDKDFFAYGDDTDLGLKGRLAGWKCLYVPTAIVYHKYSGSTSAYSPGKAFLVERNRVWILLKYFPFCSLILSPFYTLIRLAFQSYGAVFKMGAAGRFTEQHSKGALIIILLKSYLAASRGMPKMLKKRRQIRMLRKIPDREVFSWFRKYGISARELALKD
ncbi:glycosyltransferase family 2 protein [bacterium]|nr:glycosyltransferase family 2 protein [bacterium]